MSCRTCESIAASTASTPASTAASTVAAADARGVVRVEMDRQADLLSQRLDQDAPPRGFSRPAMSLIAEDMAAGPLELLGELDVIGERIFGAVGIENVAGVADRAFGELAGLAHRVDRDAHVLDPVEAVEDAEQVHARRGRLADEIAHDIVGIIGVADAVGAAQQHLGQDIGRPLAQQRQPLPRVFGQKPHRDVERRAAPAFEREAAAASPRHRPRRRQRCRRCACASRAAIGARRASSCR